MTELALIRRLAGRPLDAILATWGLGFVITQLVVLQCGRSVQFVETPIRGTVEVLGESYSSYRLFTVAVAVAVALALVGIGKFTAWGLTARAVIMNRELARGLGINVAAVRLVTFAVGAALAALAGAMLTPMFSVDPNMGVSWLVGSFMVVLVAGPR